MRSQAFGVELETKGLGLEEAARAVARALGGRATGAHATDPATGKVWKAVRDGSLHGTSAEVVTPKLTYDELPKLQEVVRALRRAGARVDHECSCHVHVTGAGHDARSLTRLAKLIHSKEQLLFKALRVDSARLARYTRPVDEAFLRRIVHSRPEDLRDLNRAWYGHENRRPTHFDLTRYHGLNLHAVWDKGTIEYRYANGTLHAGKVKAYVQLFLALTHKALTGHGATHRVSRTTNEKFTFRVWLVGLGLKGDEFKAARKHLTAHLSGNSAWRHGRPAPRVGGSEAPAVPAVRHAAKAVYLENRNDGHFKFYRIEWDGDLTVRTTWGRIGTGGRSAEERVANEAELRARVEAIMKTRLSHGYTVVSDSRVAV
jgi:predicted DNA-binding WGR domain protein